MIRWNDDLVARLEAASSDERLSTGALYKEAADEIERLRAERDAAIAARESVEQFSHAKSDEIARLRGEIDATTQGALGQALKMVEAERDALRAENVRLTKAVNEAREVAMIRHCDVNANGKTILDFHEVWLRQANQRAERAEKVEAERDALRADAERYRWLRDTGWSEELERIISQYRNVQFDAAIDAAMKDKP